ncbi:MAG: hypothetical protein SGBAC_006451 [Bacillariaceae sp.]
MKLELLAFLCSVLPAAKALESWAFAEVTSAKVPIAVSDHSGVRSPDNGIIYLAGGCDHPSGNVWNADFATFVCNSVTDAFFAFDPVTKTFETLETLPRPRYRHSSAIVGGKVWLLGGRTLFDDLIPEIDAYDIATNTWSTPSSLPAEYVVSDQAGFGTSDIYIAGGYDQNYTAMTTVVKISGDGQTFTKVGDLNEERGDVFGVAKKDGTKAYVAGGFTHSNWCKPLTSAEEFDFATETWTSLPDLVDARGEIALVENSGHLYAIGGEGPLDEGLCASNNYTIATKTVATDRIEILNDGETAWQVLEDFPEERFRFAAVGVEEDDVIYTFGGQVKFDEDCQCFKTTDKVFVYGKPEDVAEKGDVVEPDSGSAKSHCVTVAISALGLVLAFL